VTSVLPPHAPPTGATVKVKPSERGATLTPLVAVALLARLRGNVEAHVPPREWSGHPRFDRKLLQRTLRRLDLRHSRAIPGDGRGGEPGGRAAVRKSLRAVRQTAGKRIPAGCRFDTDQEKRGTGHTNVTVHREGRKAEVPLGGPHQILDARIVRRACEELGLDWSELLGPKSRV
jgi:hypothetical protein